MYTVYFGPVAYIYLTNLCYVMLSVGKELSRRLFTFVVLILNAILVVLVPFPFGVLGRDVDLDCVDS